MMKWDKTILFAAILILLIPSITATYKSIGTADDDFQTGTGIWTSARNTDYATVSKAIGNTKFIPLVADLDNNTIDEIIAIGGTTLYVYQGTSLTPVQTIAISNVTGEPFMNVYDIDGDGNNEIILSSQSSSIDIIEFNGTHLYIEGGFHVPEHEKQGYIITECKAADNCIAVATSRGYNDPNVNLSVTTFSSTGLGAKRYIHAINLGGAEKLLCFPRIPNIAVSDYDADSTDEYIFTVLSIFEGGGDALDYFRVYYVSADYPGNAVNERNITNNELEEYLNTQTYTYNCTDPTPDRLYGDDASAIATAPLVFDAVTGGGMETVVGFMSGTDAFNMRLYDQFGTSTAGQPDDIWLFPKVFLADGQLLGNPIRANAIRDTGNVDFCVMGIEYDDKTLDLLCGSAQTGETIPLPFPLDDIVIRSREFKYNYSQLSLKPFGNYSLITHSGQYLSDTTEGTNLNEIATAFGTFSLDYGTSYGSIQSFVYGALDIDIFRLRQQFLNPAQSGVMIPADAENNGNDDLILLTKDSLVYINDLFVNSQAQITHYTINPCIESTWKVNTTAVIQLEVTDANGDDVAARSIIYAGHPNQQDGGWQGNFTSGTTVSFNFVANQTLQSGIVMMQGQDVPNAGDDADTINLSFSVGLNGVEYGDCITNVDIDLITADEITGAATTTTTTPQEPINNNSISYSMGELNTLNGLGSLINWLLITLALFIAVMIGLAKSGHLTMPIALVTSIVCGTFMLVVGTYLGFIPIGIIIAISVISISIIIIWAVTRTTGSANA